MIALEKKELELRRPSGANAPTRLLNVYDGSQWNIPVASETTLFSSAGQGWSGFIAEGHRVSSDLHIDFSARFHLFYIPLKRNASVHLQRAGQRERVCFVPGTVGFRPAGEQGLAHWDSDLELFVLGIDPTWFAAHAGGDVADAWRRHSRGAIRNFQLETTIRDLMAEIKDPRHMSESYAECLVRMITIQLARMLQSEKDLVSAHHMSPAKLRRVLDYVDSHLVDRISLPDLAREAGMSVRHFCRCFQTQTGRTPHRYILHARIQRAKVLMECSDAKLAQIAFEVGFKTHAHFCHVFRRVTGETPKRFLTRK